MIETIKPLTVEILEFDKWNYSYDGLNRVTSEQNPYFEVGTTNFENTSNSANKTFYTYDLLSRVTKVIGPDGTSIIIDFNHWIVTAYDQNSHRKQYLLDSYGRIKNVVEYNWDDIVRKDEVYNTSYAYDTTDNLIYINDSLGNEFRFRYDSLGRKIQLDDLDLGTWYYKYDLAGNLVQQVGGGGNLVTGDGYYREYNDLQQLIRVRNGSNSSASILEEYDYDYLGNRIMIKRYDAANTTVYTPYREWTRIINVSGSYDFTYVYDGGTLVGRINPDNSKYCYQDDHLGSTTLITNESGAIIEQTFFEPFGLVEEGGTAEDKLYTGQFSDDLTGQYYYGARYYLPIRGQFGQADPIVTNIFNPQAFNRYSYVLNNPYLYTDPNGLWAVIFGRTYSGGALITGSASIPFFAISYHSSTGIQIGLPYQGQVAATIGAGAKATFDFTLSTNAKSLENLKGPFDVGGGSSNLPVPVPIVGGYDYASSEDKKITTHTIHIGPGIAAEVHRGKSYTAIPFVYQLTPPSTNVNNPNSGSTGGSGSITPLIPSNIPTPSPYQPPLNPNRPPHPPRPTPQPSPSPNPQPAPIWPNPFKPNPQPLPCYCIK